MIHAQVNPLRLMVSAGAEFSSTATKLPSWAFLHWQYPSAYRCPYMPALPVGQGVFLASSPGMDSPRLLDAQPIFDQLPDLLTGFGVGNFSSLIRIQPDFLFATAEDTGGKPLLKPEHTVTNRKHYQALETIPGQGASPARPALQSLLM